jgi:ATP-dependent DNA ligase
LGRIGALVIGFMEEGELRCCGKVGTGFDDAELKRLQGLLDPLASARSPFSGRRTPSFSIMETTVRACPGASDGRSTPGCTCR